MKRRKFTFAEQMIFLTSALLTVIFVETVILITFLYKYIYTNPNSIVYIIGILFIAFFITCLMLYRFVLVPYGKCRLLFRKFINGNTYKELFDEDYQVFPEMRTVLELFDKLLDKQNVIQLSTKQAEFLALQNQINPHFLYNTLEAIRGDALCAGLENIAEITEALSTFFRYTITETGNLVTLENELENVENYFTIQRYRFGEKLKMEIQLPEEKMDVLQLQIPKLTLQPIIENAIFHGLERKAEGGTIIIEVETTTDKVLISIRDDGVGIPEEELDSINKKLDHISVSYINEDKKKRESIALNNVCRRIKLLFGEEYGIHIFSIVEVGTDVRINIPIIKV
jgi:Predicted signal transduction protein with a C-terminal ATPase domain